MSKNHPYFLDDLKACIGLLQSTGDLEFLWGYKINETLKNLNETARKDENCLQDLKDILDKLKNNNKINLKFDT